MRAHGEDEARCALGKCLEAAHTPLAIDIGKVAPAEGKAVSAIQRWLPQLKAMPAPIWVTFSSCYFIASSGFVAWQFRATIVMELDDLLVQPQPGPGQVLE